MQCNLLKWTWTRLRTNVSKYWFVIIMHTLDVTLWHVYQCRRDPTESVLIPGFLCLQNSSTKANLPLSLDTQKLQSFHLHGVSPPWPPESWPGTLLLNRTRGSAPGPRWGLCPQIPESASFQNPGSTTALDWVIAAPKIVVIGQFLFELSSKKDEMTFFETTYINYKRELG